MRRNDDWCILRTTPSGTLALAVALVDAGIAAWTPVAKVARIKTVDDLAAAPLAKPRFGPGDEMTVAVVPRFVFAPYDRLSDLFRMASEPSLTYRVWDKEERRMVMRGHPHFTVFRIGPIVPRVPDRDLDALRQFELDGVMRAADRARRKRGKRNRRKFDVGQTVRVPDGPFAGMPGVVIPGDKSGSVRVQFCDGLIEAEIAPWLVQALEIDSSEPLAGAAARAA